MGMKTNYPSSEEWGHDNTEMGDFPGAELNGAETDLRTEFMEDDMWAI